MLRALWMKYPEVQFYYLKVVESGWLYRHGKERVNTYLEMSEQEGENVTQMILSNRF